MEHRVDCGEELQERNDQIVDALVNLLGNIDLIELVGRYVKLKVPKKSPYYRGFCPFHQQNEPTSFRVHSKKGFYNCFGCASYGNAFAFYAQINGFKMSETINLLAKENGLEHLFPERWEEKLLIKYFSNHPEHNPIGQLDHIKCPWEPKESHSYDPLIFNPFQISPESKPLKDFEKESNIF